MVSKWVKLTTDRKHPEGLVYFCKEGHDWFMPFSVLREIESSSNICPTCYKDGEDGGAEIGAASISAS